MQLATLQQAIQDAERFLERARKLKEHLNPGKISMWDVPKDSAAVKRASMDLTRRLADLRQGR